MSQCLRCPFCSAKLILFVSPQWNDRGMGLQMKLYLDVFSKRCSGQLMRACSQKIKATLLAGYRLSFLSNHMCNFSILCKYNWGTLYSGYCVALIQSILFELLKNPVFVMYSRQKIKPLFLMVCVIFTDAGLFFFLANLISILGVNKGHLVERGEKCFLLISRFIGTHLELCLFILNFFSCKRRDVFEHFFFHKSAVHQKCRN